MSHRKLYVFISVGLCLLICSLILFFLFPRSMDMSAVELKSSMVYFTPDKVKIVITVSVCKCHIKICLLYCIYIYIKLVILYLYYPFFSMKWTSPTKTLSVSQLLILVCSHSSLRRWLATTSSPMSPYCLLDHRRR